MFISDDRDLLMQNRQKYFIKAIYVKGLVMFYTLIYKMSWSFRVLEKQAKHVAMACVPKLPPLVFYRLLQRFYITVYRDINPHSVQYPLNIKL